MDFGLSREESLFRDSVREFGERYVKPRWIDLDEGKYSLLDLIPEMSRAGLVGLTLSSRYGGAEGSFTMAALAAEELAYADPSLAVPVYFLLESAWPFIVQRYGRDEVKEEVLPRLTRGEAWIGIASTEPQGGSDVASVRTTAQRSGKSWIIRGEKNMVTGVPLVIGLPYGGGFVTITRTGPLESRHRGVTTFLVLLKRGGSLVSGFESGDYAELGRGGIPTGFLRFNGVEVGDEFILGELNGGFKVAMEGFNLARAIIGAASVGVARWLLEQGREWIKSRVVFGKPIASYQGVSFRYAELATRLEAARLMVMRAAWIADRYYRGDSAFSLQDLAVAGAMAKMNAVELAVEAGLEVMKWFGGMSYFKETPIARALLSALSYYVGAEGTQNIMRLIIARGLIGREVD